MPKERMFYPDTNYIYHGFEKKAEELRKKLKPAKKIKPRRRERIDKLTNKGVKFIISELTEFEIVRNLMKEQGLTYERANEIFEDRLKECPSYHKQAIKSIEITYDAITKALKNGLELIDLLHILTAARLDLWIITKEEKYLENWKKVYDGVFTPEQFQKYLETLD